MTRLCPGTDGQPWKDHQPLRGGTFLASTSPCRSHVRVGFARLVGANCRRRDGERPFVPIMRRGCCYVCVCARGGVYTVVYCILLYTCILL